MKQYVASHLKDMNRQVVYQVFRERHVTSKAEISKITGISAPTVIKIIQFMEDKGIVINLGDGENAIGRKPQMLTLNTSLMYSVVFFLEGDFLTMGVVDILGNVIYKKNMQVEPLFDVIIKEISEVLIDELLESAHLTRDKLFGIGIALPVIYDPVKNVISGGLLMGGQEELNITEHICYLEKKYDAIVVIENDANSQTLGEFQQGSYPPDADLVLISIGTGMGSGVILGGKLRRGSQNMCGEIGYISFLEDYVSSKEAPGWLEVGIGYRKLKEKFGLEVSQGIPVQDSAVSRETMREAITYVAPLVALCINNTSMFLDCSNVVLGGKVVEYLGQPLLDEINFHLRNLCITGIQVKMESSEDIGLIGIASLVTDQKIHKILTLETE